MLRTKSTPSQAPQLNLPSELLWIIIRISTDGPWPTTKDSANHLKALAQTCKQATLIVTDLWPVVCPDIKKRFSFDGPLPDPSQRLKIALLVTILLFQA